MRLDLRNNPLITIEGYASLAEAMKRNHTLAFLDIDVSVSSVLWMFGLNEVNFVKNSSNWAWAFTAGEPRVDPIAE